MSRDQYLQRQFELSVQAGVSQRYHQNRAHLWGCLDMWARFLSAVLALLGGMAAAASAFEAQPKWLLPVSIALSVVASFFGFGVMVMPLATWESVSQDLFRRWSDFRADVDDLEHDLGDEPSKSQLIKLRALQAKSHQLCSMEHKPSEGLIKKLYKAECASRVPTPIS